MDLLKQLKRLWEHCAWSDETLVAAFERGPGLDPAWQEYCHVLAAEETWLARLEGRSPEVPVWPRLSWSQANELRDRLGLGYSSFLSGLGESSLSDPVHYTNSAGQSFATPIVDILLHVALHGHYHRGKINLLLRQEGRSPVPTDYIGFVRGVPAAVSPVED
jgi:uncharacterized damage-inducible protein DinB